MGDAFRGFGDMLIKITVTIVVLLIVLFGVSMWLDHEFGDGSGAPVTAMLAGLLVALLLFVIVTLLNNQTHRSAGDDIVAVLAGVAKVMSDTRKAELGIEKERAKIDVIDARDQADDRKQKRGLASFFTRRDAKARDRQGRQDAKDQAAEAEWAWVDDYDFGDHDSPEYID